MKYIFWDFNGTLLDDVELCLDILNEMLVNEGNEKVSMKQYLDIFGFPVKEYYSKVFDFNKKPFEILSDYFIKNYQPRSFKTKINENAIKLVKYYKNKGYKQIILSASQKDNLKEQLIHFGIIDLFDDFIGIDDHHAESKLEVGKKYLNKHKINPQKATMIGDTLHDAEIAEKLGMKIILYSKGHQARERLEKYDVIDDFLQLML